MQSLGRLQIDTLWGLLIHRTKIKGNWQYFIDAIEKLKKEKIIENFGVSIYQPEDALRFAQDKDIDIIQAPFNVLDKRFVKNKFFEIASKNNKKVFIRSVFLQGLLMMSKKQLIDKKMEWTLPYLSYFRDYIKYNGINDKAFALKIIKDCFPNITLIIGIESRNQLLENIELIKSKSLPGSIIQDWWSNLPEFPERLLNPSLWNNHV